MNFKDESKLIRADNSNIVHCISAADKNQISQYDVYDQNQTLEDLNKTKSLRHFKNYFKGKPAQAKLTHLTD